MQGMFFPHCAGSLKMDNYTVKIATQAKTQMFEIFTYISRTLKAPEAADRLLGEVEKTFFP